MTTRDPIINPQAGDCWERPFWKQIVVFSKDNRVIILEKYKNGEEHLWDTSLEQFQSLYSKNKVERKFIGNHPERMSEFQTLSGDKMDSKPSTTVKENVIERERAIVNPQAGDRWIWPDGSSIEVYEIGKVYHGSDSLYVCYATDKRSNDFRSMKSWRAFLHAATFVGTFAPKTEKRDPKKNPQSEDKWEVTRHYYNFMYDGTYKEITTGSTLIINSVTQQNTDVYVYGYFTNGVKFICPMKEFEARTQSFKFVE